MSVVIEMESCDKQPKINRNNVYILYLQLCISFDHLWNVVYQRVKAIRALGIAFCILNILGNLLSNKTITLCYVWNTECVLYKLESYK